ncbi:sigma 54-interacting transcriptional regulator [Desulfosporosinus sp. PR]|uniref:sigma-54 interaction domain-containing protein n=1 Tax=Candidatus Desulfosporosinus nitrosoreducens TaxID=3401928 RepID=UPI0027F3F9C2|nr:sigma 54-interacting transcriptional regulator [Desulfosporosinus sp. PR]MDQ7096326.1 sigma 54-interacting transcriptional regulator [Desulfosporosinus sp. PR]
MGIRRHMRWASAEALRKKVHIYETILNSIHEGVLITDPKGYVIFYNQEIALLEGLNPEDVVGRHLSEIYSQPLDTSEHLRVSRTAQPIRETYQKYFTRQGLEVHLVASTVPVLRQNELLAVYSVCREATHLKEMLLRTMQIQEIKADLLEGKKNSPAHSGRANFVFADIIGKSKAMEKVIRGAQRAMSGTANILVYGETGTGKELLVQSIHNGSPRKHYPFVAINCSAIPENLLETMLFGAVKGAYTGAVPTTGIFEYVDEGTLYLDEINSMSLGLQAKLLRALQERTYRKVGSVTEIPLRCRIISSINVDPMTCLQKKLLREDLFYRLSVISLTIPPLRERKEDIPCLIEYFIKKHSPRHSQCKMELDPELARMFQSYRWAGNIRELENAIESMICMAGEEKWLTCEHLPMYLKQQMEQETFKAGKVPSQLSPSLLDMENSIVTDALKKHRGNLSRAAKELGILRQSLQYRVKKLGIDAEQFRH